MTKARRFPVTDIQRAVQDCLSTAPRVVDELERITGYAASSIRICLARLEATGEVCRERKSIKRAKGYYYLYHLGPVPMAYAIGKRRRSDRGAFIVRDYEPHHVRDPLVAALFGQARKEAA